MNTTALNPSIVGQAEKAHGAVLKKVLAGTTLDEQQWITLQFADAADAGIQHGELIERVAQAAKFDAHAIESAITALSSAGLLEQRPDGNDQATPEGRELVASLRERIGGLIAGAYSSVPPEDLATAARVLVTITARLSADLAAH